jgi:hypothetical protein
MQCAQSVRIVSAQSLLLAHVAAKRVGCACYLLKMDAIAPDANDDDVTGGPQMSTLCCRDPLAFQASAVTSPAGLSLHCSSSALTLHILTRWWPDFHMFSCALAPQAAATARVRPERQSGTHHFSPFGPCYKVTTAL